VIVDGDGKLLFRVFLANHVLVKVFLKFQRLGKFVRGAVGMLLAVILKNGIAYGDAFVADVSSRIIAGGGNELPNYVLTLMTKRTTKRIVRT
jgi:hypothetical protein